MFKGYDDGRQNGEMTLDRKQQLGFRNRETQTLSCSTLLVYSVTLSAARVDRDFASTNQSALFQYVHPSGPSIVWDYGVAHGIGPLKFQPVDCSIYIS